MLVTTLKAILSSLSALWFLTGAMVLSDVVQAQLSTSGSTSSTQASPTQQQPLKALNDRAEELWQEHQLSIILAGLVLGGYLGILGFKPLWLLKVPSADLPMPWTSWKIPLGLVRPLKYPNRVLDAWVAKHWQMAQSEFLKLPTVEDRSIHISLSVRLNKSVIGDLSGQQLTAIFQKKPTVLLIAGEGGAGKTSLACQIAQWGLKKQLTPHRMLPILIETELDDQVTLLEAIRGQLSALTNQSEPISSELLEKLLQRQRVLVIVDHFSEMGERTRAQVRPELADFPAKVLILTSRIDETLGGIPKTVLKPLQIEANRLWPFMSAYLEAKGKQGLFEDDEYASGCDRLRRMAGERSVTVLLARLYIDHMIQEQEGAGGILPDSVPKLMLSYLNQLNRAIEPGNKQNDLSVQQDAKVIAWECLKQTYRPTSVKKVDAISALDQIENKIAAKERLDYLEQRLQFLQTPEPGDKTRIILDPLAEYLAALYLLERNCQDEQPEARWRDFLADIDQTLEQTNEPPELIRGFLLAVRDCCLDNSHEDGVPEQLPAQLARKAGLDPEELYRVQERRRIRRLISDLSEPEFKDRLRAAEELGNYGVAARIAKTNLVGMLENRTQTPAVRQAAAKALGNLGLGYEVLLTLLANRDEDPVVRRSTAEALGTLHAGQAELLRVLKSSEQPLPVLQGAARALQLIGATHSESVPMLIVKLQAEQVKTQVTYIPVWEQLLAENIILNLVKVPGGEFMMGSPPDEEGRMDYASYLPDTVGEDVEAQHLVHVQSFWMSEFPITQAQWRVVAALPKVERELNANPSEFKGADRPVEQVNWYEAVEFCKRLSCYTGKHYRLPSEAEWEYACRAGTISPFHFGDTLSSELANYDADYTYGLGATGEYRRRTSDCGAFGVVNGFGLADMHGNVWEWCLDHWHPSYEGAPDDGSAWLSDNTLSNRIIRGGSWINRPRFCRSAYRNCNHPEDRFYVFIGFRVVC
ncbi:MAG: SUMF1/EgtB/PvdO family nonheme iron enzyme [Cyanothece sp. SIO1E1]|nr:SUMF1/EgtB/PvdO family nonheme iron enzyme [Cyanothece sp. SIO1E1]